MVEWISKEGDEETKTKKKKKKKQKTKKEKKRGGGGYRGAYQTGFQITRSDPPRNRPSLSPLYCDL